MPNFLKIELTDPSYYKLETPAWLEHGPFAMWLVKSLRPRKIVELGTHWGYSYFAMCEAVHQVSLPTQCIAVDTWVGDIHAGQYGEEVFDAVSNENKKYSSFSKLLRKTFDAAREDIEDGTVDLLHVDERHFYDDVKEDYERWIPKLSDRAVVMFHDTMVFERGFGVHQYWQEISAAHPSFNFTHGHGLGVLFPGKTVPTELSDLIKLLKADSGTSIVREFFQLAGSDAAERMRSRVEAKGLRQAFNNEKDQWLTEIDGLTKQSDQQAAEIAQLIAHTGQQAAEIANLKQELLRSRTRPLRAAQKLLQFRALTFLAKTSAPISQRRAARFAKSAAKRDPSRHMLVQKTVGPDKIDYENVLQSWSKQRAAEAELHTQLVDSLKNGPLISVVVPVYNPNPVLLREMIDSVLEQSYPNWELCIADDCSTNKQVVKILKSYIEQDNRIRAVFRKENGHISRATNSAIDIAKGQFIALLDHDDLLDPDALLWVAKTIQDKPSARIIYTDEDKVREDGSRYDPHFKPDWNRELLYGINYVSHLGIYETTLLREVGGLRVGFEGAQDYDLLLRCIEQIDDSQITHIPKVLYSWRATAGSTAVSNTAKPYATEAGLKALTEHLHRKEGEQIPVEPGPFPFTYRILWPLNNEPLVSIIIPTRDQLKFLQASVQSLLDHTDYKNFEILIVDNNSVETTTLSWFAEVAAADKRVRVLRDERPFNYSALNNAAVQEARGEIIALVNNDVEIIDQGWLKEMVTLALRPDVGCVGAKLLFPDGRIQHAGVVIGIGGVAGHGHLFSHGEHPGYFSRLTLRQEYTAVTAACLVVRRSVYEDVGGLNETDLCVAFNDVDFCLKVHEAGFRNVWTPWARLYHHESVSRGYEDTPKKKARFAGEMTYMKHKWATDRFADPAYNPNLTLDRNDFGFAEPRWTLLDQR